MEDMKFPTRSDVWYRESTELLLSSQTPHYQNTEATTLIYTTTTTLTGSGVLVNNTFFLPWDNPDNIISHQTYLRLERGLFCYAVPALFLIGVPTNFLNCVVFYKQGLRDRMNLCLFCLALVDMMFVATFSSLSFFCALGGDVDVAVTDWWKVMTRRYVTGLYRGFLFSSGSLTMIISVERCACVFLPMRAATLIKTRTMAAVIVATVVTLQGLCLVYPFKVVVVEHPIHAGGTTNNTTNTRTTFALRTTRLYRDNRVVFDLLVHVVIMTVIPFVTFFVVVVATALTVIQLKRAMAWRSSASANADTRKERRLVVMLVTVSCLFIVTASPNIALGLARIMIPDFWFTRRFANVFLATHAWYLALGMLNSSVNFFVYVLRSSRFRQELTRLCPLLMGLCARTETKRKSATDSCSSSAFTCTTKGGVTTTEFSSRVQEDGV